jgi:IS4 transposase
MDKGYVDFGRLHRVHCAGAFFITRAKKNMDFGVRKRQPVNASGGVVSDRLIRLRGPKSRDLYPDTLRMVRYVDPQTGKRLKFLTNNLTLAATTVALLYRKRWRIELFFKWIKQHLHIKIFFGTTPNAVKIQLWVAVMVYVLVHRLKHAQGLSQNPNEILQILGVTLFEKIPVKQVFSESRNNNIEREDCNQLSLFEF